MTQSKQSHKIFQGAITYLRGYFIAYDVKGQVCHNALRASLSGKNRCVALGHWLVTQVFPGRVPCNSSWTACVLLCPQNFNNLKRTCNSLLILDPERSSPVHIRVIYSQWIWVRYQLKVCNDRWEKHSCLERNYLYGSEILIPDPKISGSPKYPKNLFIFVCSVSKLYLLSCVWRIQLRSRPE